MRMPAMDIYKLLALGWQEIYSGSRYNLPGLFNKSPSGQTEPARL
jgi:hypothetical protein